MTSFKLSKTPNFRDKNLLGIIILLVLGGVFLYANYGDKLPIVRDLKWPSAFNFSRPSDSDTTEVKEFKFANTTIRSDLSYAAVQRVYSFLTDIYKEEFLPEELSLLLQNKAKNGEGDEYAGGWTKGGIFLNVLYVTSYDLGAPTYLRAWYLPPAVRNLDKTRAQELLKAFFNERVLSQADNLTCKEAKAENDLPVTACDFIGDTASGDKEGILVRTPLLIPNSTPATVVSVCLYPQSSRLYKSANFCI